jgi:hypothetical protein
MNDDRVAIVGSTQVGDPDGLWTADVDGSATGIMVEMTNAIAVGVKRPIQFFHLPVPKGRTDDAYYVRLETLKLGPEPNSTSVSSTTTTPRATPRGLQSRGATYASTASPRSVAWRAATPHACPESHPRRGCPSQAG